MTYLEAAICGLIQGLSEFLPISSSGHLALAHHFFGTAEGDLIFDLLLHLATLTVVLVFYRKDIFPLVPAACSVIGKLFGRQWRIGEWTAHERYVLFLLIGTLPMAAALFIDDKVEGLAAYPNLIGGILVCNGCVLLFADHMAKRVKHRKLTPKSALTVGIFQLFAVIPGLSRSGSTTAGGLCMGLSREDAVKFSFILSLPAILGANLVKLPEAFASTVNGAGGVYLVGMLSALLSGFCAMKLLHCLARRSGFGLFAYYSIVVGLLALWLV